MEYKASYFNKMKKLFIRQEPRLKQTLRLLIPALIISTFIVGLSTFLYMQFANPKQAKGAVETLPTGTFIINMVCRLKRFQMD